MNRLATGLALGTLVTGLISVPSAADGRPDLTHIHASQRYDRPVELLRAEVARHTRRPVSLITWTEVQGPARSAPLHRSGDGWAARTDPRTDVAISWRLRRWTLVRDGVRLLTPRTFVTTGGFTRRTRMIFVVLDRHDRRLLVTVAHLPARRSDVANAARRVAVWGSALDGWGSDVRELRRRWEPDAVLTVADWNVDVRRPFWRQRIRTRFPGQRFTWTRPLPSSGTHGTSLIDATLTNLTGRARLLRHTPASDHTAYVERLRR